MKLLLLNSLAPLASKTIQEKYIVHGTTQEYLVPSELLDQAATVCARALSASSTSTDLNTKDIEAIRQFDVVLKWEIKDFDVESFKNDDLVHSCAEWAEISRAAGICLSSLGFSPEAWEQRDA
jgi:hypothetical protein